MGWRERWRWYKHNTSNFSLVTNFLYSFLPSSSSSATTARTEFFPGLRFGSPNICHVNKATTPIPHQTYPNTVARTRNAHGLETPLMSHFHPLVLYRVHKENNHKYKYFRPSFALPPSTSPCILWHCFGGIRCAISLTHPVPIAQFHFIIIQPLSNVSAYWLNFFVRSFVHSDRVLRRIYWNLEQMYTHDGLFALLLLRGFILLNCYIYYKYSNVLSCLCARYFSIFFFLRSIVFVSQKMWCVRECIWL